MVVGGAKARRRRQAAEISRTRKRLSQQPKSKKRREQELKSSLKAERKSSNGSGSSTKQGTQQKKKRLNSSEIARRIQQARSDIHKQQSVIAAKNVTERKSKDEIIDRKRKRSQIDRLVTAVQDKYCASSSKKRKHSDSFDDSDARTDSDNVTNHQQRNEKQSQCRRLPWELYLANSRSSSLKWNPAEIVMESPPWKAVESKRANAKQFGDLHHELYEFYEYVKLSDAEVLIRQKMEERLHALAKVVWQDGSGEFEIFGSYISPLSIYSSDVDARIWQISHQNVSTVQADPSVVVSPQVPFTQLCTSSQSALVAPKPNSSSDNSSLAREIAHGNKIELVSDSVGGSVDETVKASQDSLCDENAESSSIMLNLTHSDTESNGATSASEWDLAASRHSRLSMCSSNTDGDRTSGTDEGDDSINKDMVQKQYKRVMNRNEAVHVLSAIHKTLRSSLYRRTWVKGVHFRKRAKVPIVNIRTTEGVECDVGVAGTGLDSARTMRNLIHLYKELPILIAPVKVALKQSCLDKTFTGGLSSFKLYMLVARHLQSIREHVGFNEDLDVGGALVSFLGYFGQSRNLNRSTEISVGPMTVNFVSTFNVHLVTTLFTRMHVALLGKLHTNSKTASSNFVAKVFTKSPLSRIYHSVELHREREQSRQEAIKCVAPTDTLTEFGPVLDSVNEVVLKVQNGLGELNPLSLEEVFEADRTLAAHLVEMITTNQRSTKKRRY